MEEDFTTSRKKRRRSANPSETAVAGNEYTPIANPPMPWDYKDAEPDPTPDEKPKTTRTKQRAEISKLKNDNAFLLTVITVLCAILMGMATGDICPEDYIIYIKYLLAFAVALLSGRFTYLHHKDNINARS